MHDWFYLGSVFEAGRVMGNVAYGDDPTLDCVAGLGFYLLGYGLSRLDMKLSQEHPRARAGARIPGR